MRSLYVSLQVVSHNTVRGNGCVVYAVIPSLIYTLQYFSDMLCLSRVEARLRRSRMGPSTSTFPALEVVRGWKAGAEKSGSPSLSS
ncbi:MAG: hypothetical protein QXH35_08395 [Nitrososphaerota archaeon]